MLRHARVLVLTAVGAIALGAAGCASAPEGSVEAAPVKCPEGSDCYDVPKAIGDGGSFSIEAGEFFFRNLTGTYWAGDIEVTLDDVGGAEHNIVIIGANEGSDGPPIAQALPGDSATGTVNLFEGDYVFYCSIPGHRAQGMEGQITVYATQDEAEANLPDEIVSGGGSEGDTASESTSPSESGSETESASPSETTSETASPTASETSTGA